MQFLTINIIWKVIIASVGLHGVIGWLKLIDTGIEIHFWTPMWSVGKTCWTINIQALLACKMFNGKSFATMLPDHSVKSSVFIITVQKWKTLFWIVALSIHVSLSCYACDCQTTALFFCCKGICTGHGCWAHRNCRVPEERGTVEKIQRAPLQTGKKIILGSRQMSFKHI